MYKLILTLIILTFTNSCIPLPLPTISSFPEINSRIIDASTNLPIEGVSIELHGFSDDKVKTDAKGEFTIKDISFWDYFGCIPLAPVGLGFGEQTETLILSHPKYESISTEVKFRYNFLGWDFCGNAKLDSVVGLKDTYIMYP